MAKKSILIMLAFALVCGSLIGVPTWGQEKSITIALVPKMVGHPYWNACEEGAKKAAEDFGIKVIFTAPTEEDVAKQIAVIEDLISKRVDAVIISPVNSEAMGPVIDRGMAKGVAMFTWDIDAPGTKRIYCTTCLPPEDQGRDFARSLAKEIGYEGKVALLTGALGSDALNRRLRGAEEILKKYPKIKIVGLEACADDFQLGVSGVENLLQAHQILRD